MMVRLWDAASTVWRLFDRRDHLLVLTLHRLDCPHGLPASTIETSLRFLLGQKYRFVKPEELLQTGVQGRMAMLTVDDGHMEVYSTLYPLIRSLQIPLVVCVTTDFALRNQWLWFDKHHWITAQIGAMRQHHNKLTTENLKAQGSKKELNEYLKTLSTERRDAEIDKLARDHGVTIPPSPEEGFRPMSKSHLKEMLASGLVDLASHTVTHPIMTKLSDEQLHFELRQSKKELEDLYGRMPKSFCYPNGLPGDFDTRTRQAIAEAGYEIVFTSIEGINYKKTLDLKQLRRVHFHRKLQIFKKSTSGLGDFINQLKNYRAVFGKHSIAKRVTRRHHDQKMDARLTPIHFPEEGIKTNEAITIRRLPYPYRAMLAICSDLDSTPDGHVYFSMMKYLNTREHTAFGTGVGLEVGNTIYFDVSQPQFCYWNTSEAGRAMARNLIHSGHIDSLHSFGSRAVTREDAGRALEELDRHNCRIKIWVDHARVPTNFGNDVTQGTGDVIGSPAYHADLSTDYGIQYVWRGRVTSVIGQGIDRSLSGIGRWRHPISSGQTILKEFAKGISTSPQYEMNRTNEVLRETFLRSGQPVREFLRSNSNWLGVSEGATADVFPETMSQQFLDCLVKKEGVSIIYTHLGRAKDCYHPFSLRTQETFNQLSQYALDGKILVTTTRRLLDYCRSIRQVTVGSSLDGHGCHRIDIASGGSDTDLSGLTIYTDHASMVKLYANDQEVKDLQRNPPDHTGRSSVSLPWRKLEFPPLDGKITNL